MGDVVEPSPGWGIPARELAPAVKHSQNHAWNRMEKDNSHPGEKNGEKQQEKAARQAKSWGVQPGEQREGMIWCRTKGERRKDWEKGQ